MHIPSSVVAQFYPVTLSASYSETLSASIPGGTWYKSCKPVAYNASKQILTATCSKTGEAGLRITDSMPIRSCHWIHSLSGMLKRRFKTNLICPLSYPQYHP